MEQVLGQRCLIDFTSWNRWNSFIPRCVVRMRGRLWMSCHLEFTRSTMFLAVVLKNRESVQSSSRGLI